MQSSWHADHVFLSLLSKSAIMYRPFHIMFKQMLFVSNISGPSSCSNSILGRRPLVYAAKEKKKKKRPMKLGNNWGQIILRNCKRSYAGAVSLPSCFVSSWWERRG